MRQNFEANRSLAPSSEEYTKQIAHAEEVAKFLKANVVQGQAVGDEEGTISTLHPNLHARTFEVEKKVRGREREGNGTAEMGRIEHERCRMGFGG